MHHMKDLSLNKSVTININTMWKARTIEILETRQAQNHNQKLDGK